MGRVSRITDIMKTFKFGESKSKNKGKSKSFDAKYAMFKAQSSQCKAKTSALGAGLKAAFVADRGYALGAAEEHQRDGFLGVHAVFGLVEDDGLRTVEDSVRDLSTTVRGQTVHEDGRGLC